MSTFRHEIRSKCENGGSRTTFCREKTHRSRILLATRYPPLSLTKKRCSRSMLIAVVCSVVLTALFYELFQPVNRTLSLTAAFLHLVGLAILGFASLLQLAPLVVLEGGHYLTVFTPEQVQALAYLFLQLTTQVGNAFLAFFGLYCILIGYLIFRSTFLPRIIGVFMALAGLGYMTFLSPPLVAYLSPYNLAPAAVGEGSLMLWLLVVGVNARLWKEQASKAAGLLA